MRWIATAAAPRAQRWGSSGSTRTSSADACGLRPSSDAVDHAVPADLGEADALAGEDTRSGSAMLATAAINVPRPRAAVPTIRVGRGVARRGQVEDLVVADVAAERQRGLRLDASIDISEWAQPRCPSGARRTERVDREVAEQPDVGVGARHELVVDHERTADAGADREHGELAHLTTLAEPALGLHQSESRSLASATGQPVAEASAAPRSTSLPAEERRPA